MTQPKSAIKDPEVFYFRAIESKDPIILVLGVSGEQWTDLVEDFLEKHDIQAVIFDWKAIKNVRLAIEQTRYPVVQLWCGSSLKNEVVGYGVEDLTNLLEQYYLLNRGQHGESKRRI